MPTPTEERITSLRVKKDTVATLKEIREELKLRTMNQVVVYLINFYRTLKFIIEE